MCCLKIDTETLLANCLNTCKTYSFSPDDLQQIVRLMANATDRYIFSDTGDGDIDVAVELTPEQYKAVKKRFETQFKNAYGISIADAIKQECKLEG